MAMKILQARSGTRVAAIMTAVLWAAAGPWAASAASVPGEVGVHDLLTLTDIAAMALSPDGRRLAFVTRKASLERNDYDCTLYVMDARAGAVPVRLASVSPRLAARSRLFLDQTPRWSPDGHAVMLLTNLDGTDQIWSWSLEGGPPQRLTQQADEVLSFDLVPGTSMLGFTTAEPDATPAQIAIWRKEMLEEGMLLEPPVRWGDYLDARGVEKHLARRAGIRFLRWFHDLDTGSERRATEVEARAFTHGFPGSAEIDYYRYRVGSGLRIEAPRNWIVAQSVYTYDIALTPDGDRAAFHTKEHSGQKQSVLSVGDLDGKNLVEWHRAVQGQFSSLRWSGDGKQLYFRKLRYDDGGGFNGIYRITGPGETPALVYETRGEIESLVYDRATTAAIFLESTSTQPARIVSMALDTGRKVVLYDPNPRFASATLPEPRLLTWRNRLGQNAFGYLVMPPGKSASQLRPPLVIVTYRAKGFLRGGTGDEYPIFPLAAQGFAVLALDVGETSSFPSGRKGDARYERERSQVATVKAAVRAVDELGLTDPGRRALTGLSFGAGLTWQTLTHSNLFRAAIVSDRGFDPFLIDLEGLWKHPFGVIGITYFPLPIHDETRREIWQHVSTSMNALRIRAPVLLNDSDLEFAANQQTATAMQGLGKPLETHIYPDAGHIINQPAQRYSIYNRNMDWLSFWLMGKEDPAPEKRPQYTRWRLYREQHEWNESHWRRGQDPGAEFARQLEAQSFGEPVDPRVLAPMLRVAAGADVAAVRSVE